MIFVEAPWFTERLRFRLDDSRYRLLQAQLVANPMRGTVMPGCGGLRKLRFADPSRGRGSRGGVRVVYLHTPKAFRIDLLDVYGKDEKDDLAPGEKKNLARLAALVREDAVRQYERRRSAR